MSRERQFLLIALFVFFVTLMPGFASAETASQVQSLESPEPATKQSLTSGMEVQQIPVLTLNQCIETALRKNPGIVAAGSTVDVNRSRVGETRAAYYPQVNAQAAYTRTKSSTETSGVISSGSSPVNARTGSITLSQNILDFGKTSRQVDISKFNLDSSRADLDASQNTIIFNVKQAYYTVLQARRNRDVAADVIKQFQLHLDQAKGFYDVGTKARIDVIKAEVDLSNARLKLINAENALNIAWVTLNNAMGDPDMPVYRIEDNLLFQKYPITLEEAKARAFENRPDLRSLIAKQQAAGENVSLQRSGYYPVLMGNATYAKTELDSPSDTTTNSWNVGVVLTFPLFSGFLTTHQVAEAKANLYALKASEESLRQQVLLEVRQAYLNLEAAEASIATAELAASQARENLDLANGRYSAGVGSPIEVSDAFATHVAAQANYTGSLANYRIAQAAIEKAMGKR